LIHIYNDFALISKQLFTSLTNRKKM